MPTMPTRLLAWSQRTAILNAIELAYRDLGLETDRRITIDDVHLHLGDWPETPTSFTYTSDVCAITGQIAADGEILQLKATLAEWTEHIQQDPYINTDLAYEVYKDERDG